MNGSPALPSPFVSFPTLRSGGGGTDGKRARHQQSSQRDSTSMMRSADTRGRETRHGEPPRPIHWHVRTADEFRARANAKADLKVRSVDRERRSSFQHDPSKSNYTRRGLLRGSREPRSERSGHSRNKACRIARRERVFCARWRKVPRGESDLLAGRVIISLEPE